MRNPSSTTKQFLEDFAVLLETMNFKKSLLVGDLNLRIENKSDKDTIHFYNLMDRYGLAQNVKHPTHFKGEP